MSRLAIAVLLVVVVVVVVRAQTRWMQPASTLTPSTRVVSPSV